MFAFNNASIFLIQSLFDLYLMVLLLRFIFQYLKIDFYNPVSQIIVKLTSPLVISFRKVIPGYWGLDLATLILILLTSLVKLTLISLIGFHKFPHLFGLLVWALGDISGLLFKIFFYAVLANIIMSWIAPNTRSPVTAILSRLTEPLLQPARRYIPLIGGIDISPIPVLLGLQLLIILISDPFTALGFQWTIR
jgi:YggT family protein